MIVVVFNVLDILHVKTIIQLQLEIIDLGHLLERLVLPLFASLHLLHVVVSLRGLVELVYVGLDGLVPLFEHAFGLLVFDVARLWPFEADGVFVHEVKGYIEARVQWRFG